MRVSQCVVCANPLPVEARSHRRYCRSRCRVRAHRFRLAGRCVAESEPEQVALQAARIEELSQALRNAEDVQRTDAALHQQERERHNEQLRVAEERASQHAAESQRRGNRVAELEASAKYADSLQQKIRTLEQEQEKERSRSKLTETEAALATMKSRHDAVVVERKLLESAVMGLRSQVDSLTETVKRHEQRDLVAAVVGGVGALSSALAAVAAEHGKKITPLNVAEILKSLQEEKPTASPPKATPSPPKSEPPDEWRRMVGEQLMLGWRPETDDLVMMVRAVMTAEAELAQLKVGKSPLHAQPRPSVEQDHTAMVRTLKARHDFVSRSGRDAASAWWRPHYALRSWPEHQLRREQEAQLDKLTEETRRLSLLPWKKR